MAFYIMCIFLIVLSLCFISYIAGYNRSTSRAIAYYELEQSDEEPVLFIPQKSKCKRNKRQKRR